MFNNTYIAKLVGVNKSTISRELKNRIKSKINIMNGKIRNKPYNAIDSHNDYLFKRSLSKCDYKLNKYPKMKEYIEKKMLNDKWAPDVIVGYMKVNNYFHRDGFSKITYQTIYNAIRYNVINVKISDTRKMKYDPKYKYSKQTQVPENKLPYSIQNRPIEVNKREVFGHFELDTVIGTKKGKHECLLTITERKTRFNPFHMCKLSIFYFIVYFSSS